MFTCLHLDRGNGGKLSYGRHRVDWCGMAQQRQMATGIIPSTARRGLEGSTYSLTDPVFTVPTVPVPMLPAGGSRGRLQHHRATSGKEEVD